MIKLSIFVKRKLRRELNNFGKHLIYLRSVRDNREMEYGDMSFDEWANKKVLSFMVPEFMSVADFKNEFHDELLLDFDRWRTFHMVCPAEEDGCGNGEDRSAKESQKELC